MTGKERINKIMATLGFTSVPKFAKSIGRDRPDAIYNVLNGQDISDYLARDICHSYPQFSYDWILFGKGEMIVPGGEIIVQNNTFPGKKKEDSVFWKDEKIRELTEKLKDRDKIITILESYNKELLDKNDELRKRLGII